MLYHMSNQDIYNSPVVIFIHYYVFPLTACGACQFSLGNDTLSLQEDWKIKWNASQEVGNVQSLDPLLEVAL